MQRRNGSDLHISDYSNNYNTSYQRAYSGSQDGSRADVISNGSSSKGGNKRHTEFEVNSLENKILQDVKSTYGQDSASKEPVQLKKQAQSMNERDLTIHETYLKLPGTDSARKSANKSPSSPESTALEKR
jgi:hypothetical protein